MKVFCLLAFASLGAMFAQTAPGPAPAAPPPAMPNLPDETEVAVFGDGTKLTMGEVRRIYVLATAEIGAAINLIVVEPAEIVKYYDANKRKYTHVRVKAIYIAFSDDAAAGSTNKGKRPLTEAEAKAKADKLLAAIKGGAD